jgi:hypothetical protein
MNDVIEVGGGRRVDDNRREVGRIVEKVAGDQSGILGHLKGSKEGTAIVRTEEEGECVARGEESKTLL